MTHGAGSMGGGGGGGFSGGGFSGGGGLHFHGRHQHHSQSGDDCCACLCLALCGCLSYGLCLRRMSWSSRVLILWLYVVALVLTVGLVLGLGTYGARSLQAAPTDMRALKEGVSTLMCQKVRLTSVEPFTSYLLGGPPSLDPSQREWYRTQKSMYIYQNDYEYWGFYLLPGSTIRVESVAYTDITLFVIQGRASLDKWLHDPHCQGCFLRRMHVAGGFIQVNFSMTASESDDVYFVYAATYPSMFADDVTATFYVNRTLYDISGAQETCSWNFGKPCEFAFDLNSRQSVVFHCTNSTRAESSDMRVVCLPRVSMYVVLVCLLPLALGVAISFALFLLCRTSPADSDYEAVK